MMQCHRGVSELGDPQNLASHLIHNLNIKVIPLSDAVFWAIQKSDRTQGPYQLWAGCYGPNAAQLNSRKLCNYRIAGTHEGNSKATFLV